MMTLGPNLDHGYRGIRSALGLFLIICLVSAPLSRADAIGTFLDTFDDGDFSAGPSWVLHNNDDRPGTATVVDGAVRLARSGVGANDGGISLQIPVDIPVDEYTWLVFDVNAVSRSVVSGCSFHCGEYPVRVRLRLEDASGGTLTVDYALNYGGSVQDVNDATYRRVTMFVPQNQWVPGISYRLRDAF